MKNLRSFPLLSSLWLLPLAWLWFVLIQNVCVEWTVNPQYGYGWVVPALCLFLLWQNIHSPMAAGKVKRTGTGFWRSSSGVQVVLVLLALLYAPTRLVEEANPGWRLVSWALAIETIGITLCALRLALDTGAILQPRGPGEAVSPPAAFRFEDFVFPVCYFLVAVPWPSLVELPLIQGLTRADTNLTTELVGWFGIPAVAHGNVIEVATGMVGIEEACSGIRSFQATLMISLFLGGFYQLSVFRRVGLCLAGFMLSFLFNLARMSLLVWVAARKGINAIAVWHDPAGVTILVACFFCLWGLGMAFKGRRRRTNNEDRKMESGWQVTDKRHPAVSGERPASGLRSLLADIGSLSAAFRRPAMALGVWILLVEISVEGWYRWHESRAPVAAQWMVAWPTNNPTFKDLPLAGRTRQILRYDKGRDASWSDGDWNWQAVFLRWKPGRTAVHLAENHTPNVCMTAAGYTLNSIAPQEWFDVNGLQLPFSVNQVLDTSPPAFVFYCLWDDRASVQGFQTMGLNYGRRLAPVLAGLRNPGQRSLEIAVSGPDNAAAAEAALRAELGKLIRSK